MINSDDLTPASATIFRDHVIARGPARLHELAHVMKSSGGPIDEMNGSFESLVPLWTWWISFARAGYQGATPSHSSLDRALLTPNEILELPLHPAPRTLEFIEHYVIEVLTRANSSISWDFVKRRKRIQDQWVNRTGIKLPNGHTVNFANDIAIFATAAKRGESNRRGKRYDRETFLFEIVSSYPIDEGRNLDWSPSGSILSPLLEGPPPVWDDPMKVTPLETTAAATTSPAPPEPTRAGEDTLFIARGADFDNLASAPPINETAGARTLNDLGFRTLDGQPITLGMLQDGTQYFELPNQTASIDSEAHGGRLRSLILSPIALTGAEWDATTSALTALAEQVGGELRGEGNF